MFTGYKAICILETNFYLFHRIVACETVHEPCEFFSLNAKTRKSRVIWSLQHLRDHADTGPDGWTDPVAAPAYLLHHTAATEVIRAAPLILVLGPIVSHNHIGFFTFFHSPRHSIAKLSRLVLSVSVGSLVNFCTVNLKVAVAFIIYIYRCLIRCYYFFFYIFVL